MGAFSQETQKMNKHRNFSAVCGGWDIERFGDTDMRGISKEAVNDLELVLELCFVWDATASYLRFSSWQIICYKDYVGSNMKGELEQFFPNWYPDSKNTLQMIVKYILFYSILKPKEKYRSLFITRVQVIRDTWGQFQQEIICS